MNTPSRQSHYVHSTSNTISDIYRNNGTLLSTASPKHSDLSGAEIKLLMRLSSSSTSQFKQANDTSDFDLSKSVCETTPSGTKEIREWHEQG